MHQGNWPTELHDLAGARMAAYIGPRLKDEIEPMIAEVGAREHSWGLYAALVLIASVIGVYFGFQIWEMLGYLALAFAAVANFKTLSIYGEKSNLLKQARAELDGVLNEDLFNLTLTELDPKQDDAKQIPLPIFNAAGFFDPFDTVSHFHGYAPQANDVSEHAPLMSHTKMTRTDVEHYTDSEGKPRQRERTVTVFDGIVLTLDVPGDIDDSRIVITSRTIDRPRGVFARTHFLGGRKIKLKLKRVKTASLEFNRIYKVSGDDQVETHEFLDPDRVMRFINLSADLSALFKTRKPIPFSMLITRGRAYIAVETGALQSVHGFKGDAETMAAQIQTVAAQISVPHIIAQHLKLTPPPRYEWDKAIEDEQARNVT